MRRSSIKVVYSNQHLQRGISEQGRLLSKEKVDDQREEEADDDGGCNREV